jgi:hypothetical protein
LIEDPLQENTVNELTENQTLLLKKEYTWVDRAIYKCSCLDPKAAYGCRSVSSRIGWILEYMVSLKTAARVLNALNSPRSVSSR